jgi:hypothetical protein
LLLLLLGLAIRLPSLFHPIKEGHRNAQTATLTAGMIEDGRLRLDPIAPWRGDLDARLVQELPVYNLCVLALAKIPGLSLDIAGRSVSLIFWVLGFWLLQKLWSQALPKDAHFWANLLFVLAPMGWYLSTAFMPETLVQFLSIAFILLSLRYASRPAWQNLAGCAIVGVLGLMVKFPAFVHLGLFLLLVTADRQGWRGVLRPSFWASGLAMGILLLGWSSYVDAVNSPFFEDWRGWENLRGFLRPQTSRLSFEFWAPLAAYNLAFVIPVVAVPFAGVGLVAIVRQRSDFPCRIWLYLLLSLFGSWLVWAKGAAAQNYYNLPNLPIFSALFGAGIAASLDKVSWHPQGRLAAKLVFTFLLFTCAAGGHAYLARADHTALQAASWIRANSKESDLVIYQPRHMPGVWDYEHQPLLSHLTGRRTWIWTRSTPDWEKQKALKTGSFLIVTEPIFSLGSEMTLRSLLRKLPTCPPTSIAQLYPERFILQKDSGGYLAYKVCHP